MKLYDISEPDEIAQQSVYEPAVGIDLGTTNSLIAIFKNESVKIIPNKNLNHTPSVVAYLSNQAPIVGAEAFVEFGNYYASIKRLMGKNAQDLKENQLLELRSDAGELKIKTAAGDKSAAEISSDILKELKKLAQNYIGGEIKKAVITVPAHFDDAARLATKYAARLAGFEVLRLINEPTSAAIAYGFDKEPEGIYAVYDLGGGTFDISILEMQKGILQVLATGGDSNLGGDDFDELLGLYLQEKFALTQINSITLKRKAQKIKEALSSKDNWQGNISGALISLSIDEYQTLIKPLIDRTLKLFLKCIKDAGLNKEEIVQTILVGGATRTPYIKERLSQVLGSAPLDSINPDEIVVRGAAIQAHSLVQGGGSLLIDVIPLSLGIEVADGIMEKLLYRNTAIPASCTQTFATQRDGQTAIKLHVLQGESDKAANCRPLARFEMKNLPPLKAGEVKIEVTFQVDADGILTVTAYEPQTNKIHEVLIKPSYGLTDDEISKLLHT